MTTDADMRRERIEHLLRELEYEVTRGVMEREIEPRMGMQKIMPGGPTGYVTMHFSVLPSDGRASMSEPQMPRLRVVGEDDNKEGHGDV